MSQFNWQLKSFSSGARRGIITTPHGNIETPAFIFCGTKGALKSLNVYEAKKSGTQIILSNTYHLMLQPGGSIIANHGGLHKFINWNGPMLTDSGGFQIFSLGHGSVSDEIKRRNIDQKKNKSLLDINENGAIFKSYIDGSKKILTPEKSVYIQRQIGADLILVLDECTPFNVDKKYTSTSMKRSHRWSLRSVNQFYERNEYESGYGSAGAQQLYGIVQGGIYKDLRDESIEFNLKNNFFGIAIGGSLGSSKDEMYEIVNYVSLKLKKNHPIHLLGIGDPEDIWNLVSCGIDTFDCVSPTRLARHGAGLTRSKKGKINIKNAIYKEQLEPIDKSCNCLTCNNYSKAYLHHLFKAKELLGFQLLTIHNVFFMNSLMSYIRKAIDDNKFDEAKKDWYIN